MLFSTIAITFAATLVREAAAAPTPRTSNFVCISHLEQILIYCFMTHSFGIFARRSFSVDGDVDRMRYQ